MMQVTTTNGRPTFSVHIGDLLVRVIGEGLHLWTVKTYLDPVEERRPTLVGERKNVSTRVANRLLQSLENLSNARSPSRRKNPLPLPQPGGEAEGHQGNKGEQSPPLREDVPVQATGGRDQ